jgi:ferric-dicitrate binding protein FerR (iron transport regulator)
VDSNGGEKQEEINDFAQSHLISTQTLYNQTLERRREATSTQTTASSMNLNELKEMHDDLVKEFKIIVASLQQKEHTNTPNIREVNPVRPKSLSKRASGRVIVVLLLVTALLVLFGWKCHREQGLLFHTTPDGDYYLSLWVGASCTGYTNALIGDTHP